MNEIYKRPEAEEVERKAAEIRREYHADWQRKNKDKVKGYQQTYWRRKARAAMREEAAAAAADPQ